MKHLLLLFLALPFLFIACKEDDPSPDPCVDINIDTLSPEVKAIQYSPVYYDLPNGVMIDTLFPINVDTFSTGSYPVGLIISPRPDSAEVILADGYKISSGLKNDFRLVYNQSPNMPPIFTVTANIKCWYKVKRCAKPDTLVLRTKSIDYTFATSGLVPELYTGWSGIMLNKDNPFDTVYINPTSNNCVEGSFCFRLVGKSLLNRNVLYEGYNFTYNFFLYSNYRKDFPNDGYDSDNLYFVTVKNGKLFLNYFRAGVDKEGKVVLTSKFYEQQ
jgi:hypothetical protein